MQKSALFPLVFGLFIVLPWLLAAQQTQANGEGASPDSPSIRALRGPEPIVDITGAQKTNTIQSDIRAKRNQKHNVRSGHVFQEPKSAEDEDLGQIGDPPSRLSALPVKESDTIVVGTVVGAHAYLSGDKHMVYSEFEINVGTVLMSSGAVSVRTGDTVEAERIGGAVRFPSGKTVRFRIYQEGFPKIGEQYLFFLKYGADTEGFDLITGYNLKNGKVEPLDGIGFGSDARSQLPFAKYQGVDETTLMRDLQKALAGGVM
jgi:hypothetical protein